MSYIYSFLEEQAKERLIAQGYCDLMCAVIGRSFNLLNCVRNSQADIANSLHSL